MNVITLLNTFAGVGGNTKLLDRDQFEITHVETLAKRCNYLEEFFPNDTVIKTDAYQYILDHILEYDIIWASPPCPTHSSVRWLSKNKAGFKYVYPDLKMYEIILLLQKAREDKSWVVENVMPYYEPLITPTAKIGRHLIWSNKIIREKEFPPDNIKHMKVDPNRPLSRKDLRDEMNGDIGKYIINSIIGKNFGLEDYV